MLNWPSSVWKSGSAIASSDLGVLQRRVAVLVDEVELDLEPGHRVVGVEARLAQHPGEHVEVAAHLLAVPRAVGAGELLCRDLFAHDGTVVQIRARREPLVRGASVREESGRPPLEEAP